ncbi:hypothetical protein [Metabacillus sp. Hm71]
MKTVEEIMTSCKQSLKDHIEELQEQNVRAANIEIELVHYIKKLIYEERH